jgi:hypothetical protein
MPTWFGVQIQWLPKRWKLGFEKFGRKETPLAGWFDVWSGDFLRD